MSAFPSFNETRLEQIARMLGEEVTGSELTRIFERCGIQDTSGESTKWRRIYHSLAERQRRDACGNYVARFIREVLDPARYMSRSGEHDELRRNLNAILVLEGLEFTAKGEFRRVEAARTVSEAEQRAQVLTAKFQGRKMHPEVLRFCRAELLVDNYFHAVFEAVKGLMQRVREMSGLQADGIRLVDEAFCLSSPRIAFNTLQTETERMEQTGFAMLLKGCFQAIRNPRAHEPKILWRGEDDAADYLTLISLLHRKLDEAARVPSASGKP
jgi:uncharacterized protein (TIGR02391 family)